MQKLKQALIVQTVDFAEDSKTLSIWMLNLDTKKKKGIPFKVDVFQQQQQQQQGMKGGSGLAPGSLQFQTSVFQVIFSF